MQHIGDWLRPPISWRIRKAEVLLIINFGVGLHTSWLSVNLAHARASDSYKLLGSSLSIVRQAYLRERPAMAIGLAALATLLLIGSFAWRETHSQVTNANRPECDGIFDFYFLMDRYVHLYVRVRVVW